jgi:hypothetical protein
MVKLAVGAYQDGLYPLVQSQILVLVRVQ